MAPEKESSSEGSTWAESNGAQRLAPPTLSPAPICGLQSGVNLKPHVKEIAEELRWKDVWYIARKSGFTRDSIFDIMKDNRYTKWTPLLLDQWVEKMKMKGNNAARVLLEELTDLGHTYQRDSVIRILEERNPA
ncbi:unnamed protein product [Merluccius merluccius]